MASFGPSSKQLKYLDNNKWLTTMVNAFISKLELFNIGLLCQDGGIMTKVFFFCVLKENPQVYGRSLDRRAGMVQLPSISQ